MFNEDLESFAGPDALAAAAEHRRSDRVEQRLPSGARLIRFANGTTKLVLPDGTADVRFDNGDLKRVFGGVTVYYYSDVGTLFTQMLEDGQLVKVYHFSNGQVERHYADGRKVVRYADGTVKYVYADGSERAVFPDGEVAYERR